MDVSLIQIQTEDNTLGALVEVVRLFRYIYTPLYEKAIKAWKKTKNTPMEIA